MNMIKEESYVIKYTLLKQIHSDNAYATKIMFTNQLHQTCEVML